MLLTSVGVQIRRRADDVEAVFRQLAAGFMRLRC